MLITQAYVEQNRLLHAARADFGAMSAREAKGVKAFMREYGCETLLDYGAGKGSLVAAIPGAVGYDPAVPEFSARPEPADCVTCTDVLEHIEPDCLEDVLTDLRTLCRKAAYIIVSTRLAAKTLPDGRNAHLIVEPADWWLSKLLQHFDSIAWKVGPDTLKFYGRPLAAARPAPEKTGFEYSEHGTPSFAKSVKTFVDADVSIKNIDSSCARGLKELEIAPAHKRKMVLCAYGPSLTSYLGEIAAEHETFTVSGAHDVLVENGIRPFAHIEADAQKHKAQFTSLAGPGTHFYLASRCHPDVFDNVCAKADEVTIWHMYHSKPENEAVKRFYPRAVFVQGSISVAGRGLCLGLVRGYRDFSIYGMDCSFPYDESKPLEAQPQHAGKHPNPQNVFRTDPIDGRAYYTTLQLLMVARDFLELAGLATACTYEIRGTGLLAAKAKALALPHIRTPDL